ALDEPPRALHAQSRVIAMRRFTGGVPEERREMARAQPRNLRQLTNTYIVRQMRLEILEHTRERRRRKAPGRLLRPRPSVELAQPRDDSRGDRFLKQGARWTEGAFGKERVDQALERHVAKHGMRPQLRAARHARTPQLDERERALL